MAAEVSAADGTLKTDADVMAGQTGDWSGITFAAGYLSAPARADHAATVLETMISRVDELGRLTIGLGHLLLSEENGCRKPL